MREVITSTKNERIKRVVKLRGRRRRDREGRFLIEGYRELDRAGRAALPMDELYICPELYLGENEPGLVERLQAQCGVRVTEVSAGVFAKIAYRDRPEGLLAVAPEPDWGIAQLASVDASLVVVAVSIEKPGNLGTILRTADAVGASAVIVCDQATDIFNPNVVRASLGTLFSLAVVEASSEETLNWLHERGVTTGSTSPDARTRYFDADLTKPVAIVVGSEQYGLTEAWLRATDLRVSIPMAGDIDSLNAAVATAVVLYEVVRQRSTVPPPQL